MSKILDAIGVTADPDVVAGAPDYSAASQDLASKMTTLVKGAGMAVTHKPSRSGEVLAPLSDPDQVFKRAMRAENDWKAAIHKGYSDPEAVYKSWSPEFRERFAAFVGNTPQNQALTNWTSNLQSQLGEVLGKNISLTSPLSTSLAPFNLVAPSRLIYPVFAPIRGKIPRTQGQGLSYRAKVITGISGSQTGSSGGAVVDIGLPEFQGGGTIAGNWPLNIPSAGTQDAVDLNIPYRFSGLSESVSWLAQFAGQGFEDVAGLANLILLQEMMMGEEAAYIGGTSIALAAPAAPTVTCRTANTGESALTGITTNVFVKVAAANWYGHTAVSSVGSCAWTTGQVADVQISPVAGALWYNLYVTTGGSEGTYHLMQTQVGGTNFTLQGALNTTGATPASDSGTYTAYRVEGIIPTLSGHSGYGSAVYPSGWQGGYVDQSVADTLKVSVLNTALQQLYDGSGAFRADPAEVIGEAGDLMRLSDDIVQGGGNTNYRLTIEQSGVGNIRAGAAVSEFVNPATRSIVRLVVHPWWPQGSVVGMSYTMPSAMSRVSNVWEANMVQDYISVGWPVIDATYRYSMYTYGNLVCNAPQYCMLLQGIQASDRSGSVGTWS